MLEVIFLIVLGLVWIVFASVQDLKTREVADWLNFSLIIFALGFRFFYSLFNNNFNFLYQGLIGLGIFFVLGNLFYYGRMFAGGDAKLLIALGAVLPLSESFAINLRIFGLFIFALFFIGGFYGIVWSIVLSIKYFKNFKKEFSRQMKANKIILYSGFVIGIILLGLSFLEGILLYFGILIFLFSYLYIYAKSVDECCMVKKVKVKDLREGDWLYEDLKVGNKVLKKNWEGLGKKDIELIRKNYKEVRIKQGIAFVPVFLISFVLLVLFYKWVLLWFGFF